jgi:hypothetical protein
MPGFLTLQRQSLHQLIETQRPFWCLRCISMEWGIVLVLAQCVIGLEALAAGAEYGLWLHGSLVSFDEMEVLAIGR